MHCPEETKKSTHNEIERRRRDKINFLISKLSEIVPGVSKQNLSKGIILSKTFDYIQELEKKLLNPNELSTENEGLKKEIDALKQENLELKEKLKSLNKT